MSIDLAEHQKRVATKKAERKQEQQTRVRMLDQAAVKAELLLGDPKWDTFLSYIQAAVDKTTEHHAAFMRLLANPDVVDVAQLMAAKMGVVQCEARIAAFTAVMTFPKEIIAQAEAAKPQEPSEQSERV